MLKPSHLSPRWRSRTETGHNPTRRGASAGLIHLTFTSIQMKPTVRSARRWRESHQNRFSYCSLYIESVYGVLLQVQKAGWKEPYWFRPDAGCEIRSSGLTPSLAQPRIIMAKNKKRSQKQRPWQRHFIILSICYTNVPRGRNKTMLTAFPIVSDAKVRVI